jgi:lysine N6-hydroxylase
VGDHDFVAIGAGPANLSLAALAATLPDLAFQVFERAPEIRWHPGMMVRGAALQVSPIKDLVSLVDPRSPFSFTEFLRRHDRLYRSLVAHRSGVSRLEYCQYYAWVAAQLSQVQLGVAVETVDFRDGVFQVRAGDRTVTADNIVLGTGRRPSIPEFAGAFVGRRVFHSSSYLEHAAGLPGRRVLVVGGGQSAAEIVLDLIGRDADAPSALTWATGRSGLFPLDDSAFSNEWYNPGYVTHFVGLPEGRRKQLLADQRYSSDGVSQDLLQQIYARLYDIDYVRPNGLSHRVLVGHRLTALEQDGADVHATLLGEDRTEPEHERFDAVILATGYRSALPEYLAPLAGRLDLEYANPAVQADYRIRWDGPDDRRIYVQNGARHSHGVADSNLALNAWRSATILNSLCGGPRYALPSPHLTVAL